MKEGWRLPKLGEIPGVTSTARSGEKGGGKGETVAPTGAQLHPDQERFLFLPALFFLLTLCGSEPGLKRADASSVTAAFGMLLC